MSDDQVIWQCERAIPSLAGAGRSVVEEILRQLERHHWPEQEVFSIRLALEEALVNAIKHGNQFDRLKEVRITCRLFPHRLRLEIADEGCGFNPQTIPNPTDPEHLDAPCGRGILLMRSFMSRVEFNEAGNRVILEKDRPAGN